MLDFELFHEFREGFLFHFDSSLLIVDEGLAAFFAVAALGLSLGIAVILADAEVAVDDPGSTDVAFGKQDTASHRQFLSTFQISPRDTYGAPPTSL